MILIVIEIALRKLRILTYFVETRYSPQSSDARLESRPLVFRLRGDFGEYLTVLSKYFVLLPKCSVLS